MTANNKFIYLSNRRKKVIGTPLDLIFMLRTLSFFINERFWPTKWVLFEKDFQISLEFISFDAEHNTFIVEVVRPRWFCVSEVSFYRPLALEFDLDILWGDIEELKVLLESRVFPIPLSYHCAKDHDDVIFFNYRDEDQKLRGGFVYVLEKENLFRTSLEMLKVKD